MKMQQKRILDLGCGNGNYCNALATKNKSAVVYGIDISQKNIKYALENKISKNQKFVIGKTEKLPFKNKYFDEIHCYEVMEHVNNLEQTLEEIKRVLKNDGKLYLTVPLKDSEKILSNLNKNYFKQIGHKRTFDKNQLVNILIKNNFKILKYKTYNAMDHIFWAHCFKRKIRILNQNGKVDRKPNLLIRVANLVFNQDNINNMISDTNLSKKILGIFLKIFYPISIILDKLFQNKKQKIICKLL